MDDDAVQIVAVRARRPLETGHRGELAWLVVLVGLLNKIDPDTLRRIVGVHRIPEQGHQDRVHDLPEGLNPDADLLH